MKYYSPLFLILFVIMTQSTYSQSRKDSHLVNYEISFQKDTNEMSRLTETAQLLISGNKSLFQTHVSLMRDSIKYQKIDMSRLMTPAYNYFNIVKDYQRNKIEHYEQFLSVGGVYVLEQPMLSIGDWEIFEDTLTIANYMCQKATTTFGGRKWIAWFASDIPISDGPYKFSGLPGLIIQIHDEKNSWMFSLLEIKSNQSSEEIDLSYFNPTVTLDQNSFFKTKKDQLDNAIQIKKASGPLNFRMKGDDGDVKLTKLHNENRKKDNNWIEFYK